MIHAKGAHVMPKIINNLSTGAGVRNSLKKHKENINKEQAGATTKPAKMISR
jgi:hypothetical protein